MLINKTVITHELFQMSVDFGKGSVQGSEGKIWTKPKSYVRKAHYCGWRHWP